VARTGRSAKVTTRTSFTPSPPERARKYSCPNAKIAAIATNKTGPPILIKASAQKNSVIRSITPSRSAPNLDVRFVSIAIEPSIPSRSKDRTNKKIAQ